MNQQALQNGIIKYKTHLRDIAKVFNEWSEKRGLNVRMDVNRAISDDLIHTRIAEISSYWHPKGDDTGVVHETQIKTAIDCFPNLIDRPKGRDCGVIVGAMQSGKTTTALALQWAGPILYLLTGRRVYPFFIIGNQTSHEDQTNMELQRFLSYYGNVEFKLVDESLIKEGIDPVFRLSPNLLTYRGIVLQGAREYVLEVPNFEDLIHRRVGGNKSLNKIVDLSKRVTDAGYQPLMIIDEPQYGASDHLAVSEGETEKRQCVLTRIFSSIEEKLQFTRDAHCFIGLSATPFEIDDLDRIWEVRQYLSESYSGFNYFNGKPISPDVDITPPKTLSLTEFSEVMEIPFLSKIAMQAYDSNKLSVFPRTAKKLQYTGDHASYRREIERALRSAIMKLVKDNNDNPDEPLGICIRALPNNTKTEALIAGLDLDTKEIEVISYFGDVLGMSVKRAIATRKHPELPFVIFVTSRARMADAFPASVRFFIDFGFKASDLNSLLQGLLGRACGYNKKSTVVLSDSNTSIVEAYIATQGGYVHKTSRHSIPVGGYRRGAPTGMLKLRHDFQDEVVQEFFQKINSEIVEKNINPGAKKLIVKRGKGGVRTGPILLIAESLQLFEHIEQPLLRTTLFPQIPGGFHVARRGDTVYHSHRPGEPLRYSLDSYGNCRFTFRWSDREAAAQGGAAGRAKGKRDSGQHMEPTVYVEKYDPITGEIIDDRHLPPEQQKSGHWRAFMVTFPLREPVREVKAATLAYPVGHSPYNDWMTKDEKETRDVRSTIST